MSPAASPHSRSANRMSNARLSSPPLPSARRVPSISRRDDDVDDDVDDDGEEEHKPQAKQEKEKETLEASSAAAVEAAAVEDEEKAYAPADAPLNDGDKQQSNDEGGAAEENGDAKVESSKQEDEN